MIGWIVLLLQHSSGVFAHQAHISVDMHALSVWIPNGAAQHKSAINHGRRRVKFARCENERVQLLILCVRRALKSAWIKKRKRERIRSSVCKGAGTFLRMHKHMNMQT